MELALAATVRNRGKDRLRIASLATRHARNGNTRNQERNLVLLRHRVSGNLFEFFGMRRTDDSTQVTEVTIPFENLVGNGVEGTRDVARVITADNGHVLEIVRTLVARAEQHVSAILGIFTNKRTDGIGAHPRADRHGISLVHIVGGRRIGGTRLADVSALGVENHRNASTAVSFDKFLQHKHRLHTHAFVVGAIRLYHGGRHVTLERAFQNVEVEALDLLFGAAFERNEFQDRIHAEAYRVTALGYSLFETFMEVRHYFRSS